MFKRTEGYARNVGAIYRQTLADIINLVKGTKLEQGKPFNFADYGYGDEVTPMLRKMYSRVYQTIRGGVEAEWLKADENNDGLVKAVFGEKAIENHFFAKYFQHNMDAMKAFATRKTSGLDLSQRVWRYTGAYKEELENALDLALGEGTAANRLATKIQKYLDNPDRLYRRFRVRIGEDEDGNPKYGRIWKRRVYDNETQGYKWIDDNPKSYHPGTGVYRSSYRNAQRLARTETNIAYRTAEFDRWQTMPFVIGIEIKLSNNHGPEMADICDELAGIYPKGFKWTGWHPNCRCYQQPALAKDEERDQMLDRILDGGKPDTVHCEDAPTDLPPQFKGWLKANKERMERATEKGTLPYFIKDNEKIINNRYLNDERQVKKPLPKEIRERRKEIRDIAYKSLCSQIFSLPNFNEAAVLPKRSVKEWLNQPFFDVPAKNEALLDLQKLLSNSFYRGYVVDKHMATAKAHIYEIKIVGRKCWIIVRQFSGGEFAIYSISDNATLLDIIK